LLAPLAPSDAHLTIAIADNTGAVLGGHLCAGSLMCTSAEFVVGLLPAWSFCWQLDSSTRYKELSIDVHTNQQGNVG
jgi:predicted DNA-binding protein with PD1-like motif